MYDGKTIRRLLYYRTVMQSLGNLQAFGKAEGFKRIFLASTVHFRTPILPNFTTNPYLSFSTSFPGPLLCRPHRKERRTVSGRNWPRQGASRLLFLSTCGLHSTPLGGIVTSFLSAKKGCVYLVAKV